MKRTLPAVLCLLGLVSLAAIGTSGSAGTGKVYAENQGEHVIRFIMPRDLPLAKASVNGSDVGFFLIDTGSTTALINKQVAERLGMIGDGDVMHVTGIGGKVDAPVADLTDFTLGGVPLPLSRAVIIDITSFNQNVRFPVAGIVGFDTLSNSPFTIDYQAHMLTLHDPASFVPPTDALAFDLAIIGGLPAIRGKVNGGREAWLQIDTGSNGSVAIGQAQIDRWPELLGDGVARQTDSSGVGGRTATIHSELRSLEAFGHNLGKTAFQVEASGPDGGTIIGRLGNQVLKQYRLTFDPVHQKVYAKYIGQ